MRYSSQHKQETRARVLQAAASAIRARGPNGVAVTEIMARAGLTHGGFYAHFGSKNDLVGQAVATMFDEVRDRIATVGSVGAAKTSLRNILAYYLSTEHRDDLAGGFAPLRDTLRTRFLRSKPSCGMNRRRSRRMSGARGAAGRPRPDHLYLR